MTFPYFPPQPDQPKQALTTGSLYYGVFWGAMALSQVYLPVDLIQRGITEGQWAWMAALRALIAFVAAPAITRLADRQGRRVIWLRGMLALMGLSVFLFLFVNGFWASLALMLLLSLAIAPLMSFSDGILVRMARKYGLEFGHMRLWGSFGFGVAGLLAGMLWDRIGYTAMYPAALGFFLLTAWLTHRMEEPGGKSDLWVEGEVDPVRPEPVLPAVPVTREREPLLNLLRADKVLLLFLGVAFLRSAGHTIFMTYNAIYIASLTHSGFFTGLVTAGASLIEIPIMLNVEKLIRRVGLEWVILLGVILQAAGLGLWAFTVNPWLLFLGNVTSDMGFACFFVASVQFVDDRAGEEDATGYQGIVNSVASGIAPLLVIPLSGLIYTTVGPRTTFGLVGIICALGAVLMIWVGALSRQERMEERLELVG